MAVIYRHGVVEVPGSVEDVDRHLGCRKERIVVLVEAWDNSNGLRVVELVVVMGRGVPVVGVVVAPEAVVIITWETALVRVPGPTPIKIINIKNWNMNNYNYYYCTITIIEKNYEEKI